MEVFVAVGVYRERSWASFLLNGWHIMYAPQQATTSPATSRVCYLRSLEPQNKSMCQITLDTESGFALYTRESWNIQYLRREFLCMVYIKGKSMIWFSLRLLVIRISVLIILESYINLYNFDCFGVCMRREGEIRRKGKLKSSLIEVRRKS